MAPHWTALLLSLALEASADTALYDNLKSPVPLPQDHNSSLKSAAAPLFPGDSNLGVLLRPDRDYAPAFIDVNEKLPYRYRGVIEDSVYLQAVMLSSIGILAMMPESVTGWKEEELAARSLESRWKDNVSTRPVWDKDDWLINYIGHPVSGAWYYTMARNDGLTMAESAVFSAIMSTFVWEYGYEAFAEVPSIQDLIVTPLFGSLLGEWFYSLERNLDGNGGLLLGSREIGGVGYFFLDPLGSIADALRQLLLLGGIRMNVRMTIRTYPLGEASLLYWYVRPPDDTMRRRTFDYGFVITFE